MKLWMSAVVIVSLVLTAAAQDKPAARKKAAARPTQPSVQSQIDDLKKMVVDQQQQIQSLTQQLQQRQTAVEQAQQQASAAQAAANDARSAAAASAQKADDAQSAVTRVNADLTDVKANATTAAVNMQEEQKRVNEMVESPISLHYKGITITPGGFVAAETVWRQHAMGGDVNTGFNSIPFPGADQARLSEFYGSGRQSRISILGEGKLASAKLTGYYEMDWLSAGVTSNNNQSNSYTNRQRQIWGQAALKDGWSITGGQMWSLVTETGNGLDNRTEKLPMTVDAQYHVGFSWERQFGLRVVKNFNNKVWLGFAVENPQELLTAHGNASNFVIGGLGLGGGLYNATANYSFNKSPDFIFKAAFQPGWGHYEIVGVVRQFRDRAYPNATATTPSAVGAFNSTTNGGGLAFNARGTIKKHVDVGIHLIGGPGMGRYSTTTLPDATVRPNGTIALLHNYAGLGTLEWHSTKWDWYGNAGVEYASRWAQLNSKGQAVGYGSTAFNNSGCMTEVLPAGGNGFTPGPAANCNADTRNIIEGTFGFYYKFYNGPKGRIQWGPQFSYLVKNTWRGVGGAPNAIEPMIFTSLRYYLP